MAGFGILVLNKIRHSLQGYKSPRPFPISEIRRAIDYDYSVVDHWLTVLGEYTGETPSLEGRTILELGPGADLGIGLITLLRGACKYNALDVNNLAATVPESFYKALFETMAAQGATDSDIEILSTELAKTMKGNNDRLNYVVRDDFDIRVFSREGIDTVFSQAAFEHFDDVASTFEKLSATVRPGTVLIAEIDLNTHTRWIRDVDPLNIYRYSDFVYNLFRFAGSPNRVRPGEYAKHTRETWMERCTDQTPGQRRQEYLETVLPRLSPRFRSSRAEIGYLSVMICAKLG